MKLKREQWLHKLQQASPGLATREMMEQSACFVFKDGKIITFNDELLCIAKFATGITGAVHAKTLLDLLYKATDEELDVSVGENTLDVKGRNFRASIAMNQEILLPMDTVEDPGEWKSIHNEFSDALEVVQGSASRDDLHFNLTCIHLTPTHVESCDGYQCTRYNVKTGLSGTCLIKQSSAKSLIGLGVDKVSEGKDWLHFSSDGLRISCRRWVQDYINIDQLIDFTGKPTILPGGLAEAVGKAEVFSSDSGTENQITVTLKTGMLEIKGEGNHGKIRERCRISYTGEGFAFMVSPKLLLEITKRTNEVQITQDRLKIDAGKFVYVACMSELSE